MSEHAFPEAVQQEYDYNTFRLAIAKDPQYVDLRCDRLRAQDDVDHPGHRSTTMVQQRLQRAKGQVQQREDYLQEIWDRTSAQGGNEETFGWAVIIKDFDYEINHATISAIRLAARSSKEVAEHSYRTSLQNAIELGENTGRHSI